jgi:hypothetical protein
MHRRINEVIAKHTKCLNELSIIKKGWIPMENTDDFVEKLKENKEKAKKNQEHQGQGKLAAKLPNKQHSTNK